MFSFNQLCIIVIIIIAISLALHGSSSTSIREGLDANPNVSATYVRGGGFTNPWNGEYVPTDGFYTFDTASQWDNNPESDKSPPAGSLMINQSGAPGANLVVYAPNMYPCPDGGSNCGNYSEWDNISFNIINFIKNLLEYDLEKRFNAQQALEHLDIIIKSSSVDISYVELSSINLSSSNKSSEDLLIKDDFTNKCYFYKCITNLISKTVNS